MAVFHSHLVECSACCVYVLCSQLITMGTEEPTRQFVARSVPATIRVAIRP